MLPDVVSIVAVLFGWPAVVVSIGLVLAAIIGGRPRATLVGGRLGCPFLLYCSPHLVWPASSRSSSWPSNRPTLSGDRDESMLLADVGERALRPANEVLDRYIATARELKTGTSGRTTMSKRRRSSFAERHFPTSRNWRSVMS